MRLIVTAVLLLAISFKLQAQKVIVQSQILQSEDSRENFRVDSVVAASNNAIIAKLGKENFHEWTDSIIVTGKYAPENPDLDRHRGNPLDYDISQMYKYYFSFRLDYYFKIPRLGHYIYYQYAWLLNKEDNEGRHQIEVSIVSLPDCSMYPDKCRFFKREEVLSIVKNKFAITDTSLLEYKFQPDIYYHYIVKEDIYVDSAFSWRFGIPNASLRINANNGEILEHTTYPPKRQSTESQNSTRTNSVVDDTVEEECDYFTYAPVTGADKRCYFNACWAKKKGVEVLHTGYNEENYKKSDVYTWPIGKVCNPLPDPGQKQKALKDGTVLFTEKDGRKHRGYEIPCICLSIGTGIATPKGEIPVEELSEGDTVWTINAEGARIPAPIILANKVRVAAGHRMVKIKLADGRELQLTPEHPTAYNRSTFDLLEVGAELDGSTIVHKAYTTYQGTHTYDILPRGATGNYWANGILTGSTLVACQLAKK